MTALTVQKRWTDAERAVVRTQFGKLTYQEIGELVGRRWTSVRHQANALGLTQGSNLGHRYSTDLTFFAEPNPLNSYWAGFIAADGCVTGNRLQLAIDAKDASHVARFVSDVGYTGPVRNADGRCAVQISCGAYVRDLAAHFNVTPRKSLTLQPPKIRAAAEVRAFITGVIDGDGSITRNRYRSYIRPRITIYGTADLLRWIRSHFDRWSPPDARRTADVRPVPGQALHAYSVTGRRAIEVGSALREVNAPRLARKWDRLPSQDGR